MERDYKALLDAGNKAQLEKLEQNGHKKGFDNLKLPYAFKRLVMEIDELTKEYCNVVLDFQAIRHEAADVANFAHMIILATDKELENNERNA